jgi:methylglutaconyl-CoA hydratase
MSIVLFDIKGSIANVTLNRPEAHNAFDETVISHLTAIFEDIAILDEVTTIVLRGNGPSFCAGGDLAWMKKAAAYNEQENVQDAMKLATMLQRLYTLPKFTVALVQGAAMGGGLGLACCCDMVVAAENAKFALSEVKLGLIPATIGPYVMEAMGARQARRWFQTGERFDAKAALGLGIVHEVVADEAAFDGALAAILDLIKGNGPKAMAAAKKLCLDLAGQPITEPLIRDTARRIAAVRAGAEAKEGVTAFLEKRKAGWARG